MANGIDESASDDGELHRLYATTPMTRILAVLITLLYLSKVRGAPTDDQRARAQELADATDFNLGFHPIVQRILEA
jgi:hypothetical protein